MIVKVQLPLASNEPVPPVLIYNEDRTVEWSGPPNTELLDLMASRPKVFFYAHMRGTLVVLDREAAWQDW